ncbi:MAG TPA: hypothetical protein VES68_02460 [Candidatus Sulfotelmatobacter sp.]|nr:hypothetical protein [Candidatus Sulfotelmatobacter sp.]
MKKILFLITIIGVLLLSLSYVQRTNATAVSGTAGPGDECNVHAEDASHTCSAGLICVPQNDNSEGNGKCQSTTTPTPTPTTSVTPTPTPTPGEEQHYACVENTCSLVQGSGDNTCNNNNDCVTPTPTETITPTPTQTPSNPGGGGPGDGRSDNLGCGSHDCSNQSHGQVLGASTKAVLGLSTTSGDNNQALILGQILAALVLGATGFKFLKNNA